MNPTSPPLKKIPSKFHTQPLAERQRIIQETIPLSEEDLQLLRSPGYIPIEKFDLFSENIIGTFHLPYSIATNFRINQKDYLIPMVTEEPSVIAAASHGAKIALNTGGFTSDSVDPIMIGQIQILGIQTQEAIQEIKSYISNNKTLLLEHMNKQDPKLVSVGGGAQNIIFRELQTPKERMLILHVEVNVKDAMGANIVNTMVERLAIHLKGKIPGRINLRIISNLAINRIAKSRAEFDQTLLGGPEIVENILDAYEFACADPYRASTHNKGIMNGIDAVAIATGNDFRALEAGAHAYASMKGNYQPLTTFSKNEQGNLIGEIELPLAMGIIGGMTTQHPLAQLSLKILGVKSAEELCQITAAVGLAQNLAALRALANEGIQQGHMKLHNRKTRN
ncbi:MAG: hydroxymethylglutaryl-CoA reductase, degradative [Promethearchaeota archaeon]